MPPPCCSIRTWYSSLCAVSPIDSIQRLPVSTTLRYLIAMLNGYSATGRVAESRYCEFAARNRAEPCAGCAAARHRHGHRTAAPRVCLRRLALTSFAIQIIPLRTRTPACDHRQQIADVHGSAAIDVGWAVA